MYLSIGPSDLNIPVSCSPTTTVKDLVRRALALGYQTIALNTEIHQDEVLANRKKYHENKKLNKKGKGGQQGDDKKAAVLDCFPAPITLELSEADYPDLAAKQRKPVILNRLTVTVKSNDFMIDVKNSENFRKFNILAIIPESNQTLLALLKSSFRFDIITFTPENTRDGVRWNRKQYFECVESNIYFEIMYSPAIRDSSDRRRIISQSHNYHAVGRSKNIFFSSRAKSPMELRAPKDVANLAFIFGLTEQQGKDAVNATCHAVSRAAAGRKMGPFRVRIQKAQDAGKDFAPCSDSEDDESNKVPQKAKSEKSSDSESGSDCNSGDMEVDK